MPAELHTTHPERFPERLRSLDILRGAVMVLMAIDHVRVYSAIPAGGPSAGVFFTRWVTHFCAPVFVFLAGTSAFLYGRKLATRSALSRYLLVRGAWLILLELTVIRFCWTFNFDYRHYLLAGVIWVIGWCMILLALLVHLPTRAIAVFGVAIIAGHNLLDPVQREVAERWSASPFGWLAPFVYFGFGSSVELGGGPTLVILYTIVPWIGVMAAGYAFGGVMIRESNERRRICLWIGLGAIAAFLVLRGFNLYGNPRPWGGPDRMPALFSFLNTAKYPASFAFLSMTLGPAIALIPALEHARSKLADVLAVFGRVPFFYYVLHIPLIHAAAVLVSFVRFGEASPWLFANHPMRAPETPEGYTWSLGLLYLVTALVVLVLYPACRWFDRRKQRRAVAARHSAL